MSRFTNIQHAKRAALYFVASIPTNIWSETDGIPAGYQLLCFAAGTVTIVLSLFHVFAFGHGPGKFSLHGPPDHLRPPKPDGERSGDDR